MEGSKWFGSSKDDWLAEGGSRAQEAGTHFVGESDMTPSGSPGWLTRERGSESEVIGEIGGVAQVYALLFVRRR